MPILKPISGHTDAQRIEHYLEKDGRALARDFFNLSWDEDLMAGYAPELKDAVAWADEMDRTRHAYGNDLPHGGKPARTFKHFVISPDPEDRIDLPALRELACSWAKECFGDYQIAIIYHDDNASHIPHAHVVVNNTNLVTGNRLHTDSPLSLNRFVQEMADKRGLRFLTDEVVPDDGFARLAAKGAEAQRRSLTRQDVYMGRAEMRVLESGEYSWVNDIRDRVSTAKNLARNESEFRQILDMLEVDISDNSSKARRDDWIYSLRDQGTRKVSGERLGYTFGKEALRSRFSRIGAPCPSAEASKGFLSIAMHATEINDLAELHSLADALEVNARFGITSIEDYGRRIDGLRARMEREEAPRSRDRAAEQIERLSDARAFVAEKGLLPEQRPKGQRNTVAVARRKAASANRQAGGSSAPSRNIERQADRQGRDSRGR